MERVVDLNKMATAIEEIAEAEFNVAIERHENLWEVKQSLDERLYFMQLVGIFSFEEYQKLTKWTRDKYTDKKWDESLHIDF